MFATDNRSNWYYIDILLFCLPQELDEVIHELPCQGDVQGEIEAKNSALFSLYRKQCKGKADTMFQVDQSPSLDTGSARGSKVVAVLFSGSNLFTHSAAMSRAKCYLWLSLISVFSRSNYRLPLQISLCNFNWMV